MLVIKMEVPVHKDHDKCDLSVESVLEATDTK